MVEVYKSVRDNVAGMFKRLTNQLDATGTKHHWIRFCTKFWAIEYPLQPYYQNEVPPVPDYIYM